MCMATMHENNVGKLAAAACRRIKQYPALFSVSGATLVCAQDAVILTRPQQPPVSIRGARRANGSRHGNAVERSREGEFQRAALHFDRCQVLTLKQFLDQCGHRAAPGIPGDGFLVPLEVAVGRRVEEQEQQEVFVGFERAGP